MSDILKMKEKPGAPMLAGQVDRLVMRFTFIFIHAWLAITHFWCVDEGRQFFEDERKGRHRRLKRAAIKEMFPNIDSA